MKQSDLNLYLELETNLAKEATAAKLRYDELVTHYTGTAPFAGYKYYAADQYNVWFVEGDECDDEELQLQPQPIRMITDTDNFFAELEFKLSNEKALKEKIAAQREAFYARVNSR